MNCLCHDNLNSLSLSPFLSHGPLLLTLYPPFLSLSPFPLLRLFPVTQTFIYYYFFIFPSYLSPFPFLRLFSLTQTSFSFYFFIFSFYLSPFRLLLHTSLYLLLPLYLPFPSLPIPVTFSLLFTHYLARFPGPFSLQFIPGRPSPFPLANCTRTTHNVTACLLIEWPYTRVIAPRWWHFPKRSIDGAGCSLAGLGWQYWEEEEVLMKVVYLEGKSIKGSGCSSWRKYARRR